MIEVLKELYKALEAQRVELDEAVAEATTDEERSAGGRIRAELSRLAAHTHKALGSLLTGKALELPAK